MSNTIQLNGVFQKKVQVNKKDGAQNVKCQTMTQITVRDFATSVKMKLIGQTSAGQRPKQTKAKCHQNLCPQKLTMMT